MQLRNILDKTLLIRFQCSFHLRLHKLLDLLRRTTDERTGLQQGIEFGNDGLKEWGAANTLD